MVASHSDFLIGLAKEAVFATALAMAPPALLIAFLAAVCSQLRTRLTRIAERFAPVRILLWLGVACHEGGHVLGARVTWTPVHQIRVTWREGFVRHDAGGAIAPVLIGIGPLVSATVVVWASCQGLLGSHFEALAGPFGHPLDRGLEHWMHDAAVAVGAAVTWLVSADRLIHVGVLMVLAGVLSTAMPSGPDLRLSVGAFARLALVALLLEMGARGVGEVSLVAMAAPLIARATAALGLAAFCAVLSLAVVLPVGWIARR